ncbi:FAD-binding oxidoreductase [Pseudonocardiaceae bacterium YIM PH 21723]|nr:FAD-binding oxidoreductase [Pseudonocardiaceae bacterium YIM PH 21723]
MTALTRRQLISGGLSVAALAALGSCSYDEAPVSPTGTSSPFGRAGEPNWDELRQRVSGLFLPQETGYRDAAKVFNTLFDANTPAAVAKVKTPQEIQACLELAAASQTPIAARAGGHSYAGYSAQNKALIVDLRAMSQVEVAGDGTMVVGGGARLIDVYAALAKAGRLIPAGSCATVGAAGLTFGGGLSVLNRKYGLTLDWVDSINLITPDSRQLTVSPTSEPDLFWGLRGAGGGNFGIADRITFRTAPAPETLTIVTLKFPLSARAELLESWVRWAPKQPDELWSSYGIAKDECGLTGCFVGTSAEVRPLLERWYTDAGIRPASSSIVEHNFGNAMLFLAGCKPDDFPTCQASGRRNAHLGSSRMVEHELTSAQASAVVDLVDDAKDLTFLFDSLGGSVIPNPKHDSAFAHRDKLADCQIFVNAPQGQAAAEKILRPVVDAMASLIGSGSYINYIDGGQQDWLQASYGKNVDRLKSVAKKYDPNKVMAFPQGITA